MKLYNNSQKTPQSESLHKVKQNCKTPRQKMKVYTANITVSSPPPPASIWQEKTPRTVLRDYREKVSTHKYSSRQLIHTKATRIFLQHQILILYTALFPKRSVCFRLQTISSHRELKVEGSITRMRFGRESAEEQHRAAGDGF